jgi:hypothetical protein
MEYARLANILKNKTFQWIATTILLISSNIITYYKTDSSNVMYEQSMREQQMGWFDVVGNITLVDSVLLHPELFNHLSNRESSNLFESIETVDVQHIPAYLNIYLKNRGKEAAQVAFCIGKTPMDSYERTIWDAYLGKPMDRKIFFKGDLIIKESPIIQPGDSSMLGIPISISLTDSNGWIRGHVAILAISVPHNRLALTYLWLKMNDKNRGPLPNLRFDYRTREVSATIHSCSAEIIRRNIDLLDAKTERELLNKMQSLANDEDAMKRAQLKELLR